MLLGVLSDTHDRIDPMLRALELFHTRRVGLVLHLGDWKSVDSFSVFVKGCASYDLPFRGVLGNNDLDKTAFIEAARLADGDIELYDELYEMPLSSGGRLAAHHGHRPPVNRKLMSDDTYRIVLFGHSHKPKIEQTPDKLIVNPGSTAFSIPRSRNFEPTVALVDTEHMTAEIKHI